MSGGLAINADAFRGAAIRKSLQPLAHFRQLGALADEGENRCSPTLTCIFGLSQLAK
jgi:hypothetical protein